MLHTKNTHVSSTYTINLKFGMKKEFQLEAEKENWPIARWWSEDRIPNPIKNNGKEEMFRVNRNEKQQNPNTESQEESDIRQKWGSEFPSPSVEPRKHGKNIHRGGEREWELKLKLKCREI